MRRENDTYHNNEFQEEDWEEKVIQNLVSPELSWRLQYFIRIGIEIKADDPMNHYTHIDNAHAGHSDLSAARHANSEAKASEPGNILVMFGEFWPETKGIRSAPNPIKQIPGV